MMCRDNYSRLYSIGDKMDEIEGVSKGVHLLEANTQCRQCSCPITMNVRIEDGIIKDVQDIVKVLEAD